MYYLSRWYTRKELAFRSAVLYAGLLISNAFGSIIAAGILAQMEGRFGIRSWRWLFLIEGTITVVVGFLTIAVMPDYPENTRSFSPEQRRLAQVRLAEEAGETDQDSMEDTALRGLKLAATDSRVWLFMIMTFSQLLGLSFSNFFPTLTATLGFSPTITLLLVAPPWIFATIISLLNARHADITGERFFHIAGWWWVVATGYGISLSTMATPARYVSLFLMSTGYAGFTLTLVWLSNATPRPPAKRAAAIGLVNGFGNLGNLFGSYIWKANWGPTYSRSMIICLVALSFSTCIAYVIRHILIQMNEELERKESGIIRGVDRERVEEAARLEGITVAEAMKRKKGFRYLY